MEKLILALKITAQKLIHYGSFEGKMAGLDILYNLGVKKVMGYSTGGDRGMLFVLMAHAHEYYIKGKSHCPSAALWTMALGSMELRKSLYVECRRKAQLGSALPDFPNGFEVDWDASGVVLSQDRRPPSLVRSSAMLGRNGYLLHGVLCRLPSS
ncbi:hypothetical protein M569_00016 [Genlisea aurea]|uniref:Uncharacterized protein n=1 Tax=Genlisea aurea TaxID=192259 RepID=S8DB64_9LAMI|nr:hypothetical protein M569_00016 [Genlisea aurea]